VLIKVINPNSTESMTKIIGGCARAVAGPGVSVEPVTAVGGPTAIESHYDDAIAVPGVLAAVSDGAAAGVDAFVIACFGDPGLYAARELTAAPVIGIAEAAMRSAAYLTRRFSVVTTLSRTVPHARELTHRYGVADLCGGIHACEVPVLDLELDPDARERVMAECRRALAIDRSEAIVLGCAGMADFCSQLSRELGVPVIDGVAAATATAVALVRLGLRTSKAGEFAFRSVRSV
jgi:allantoin racemase